MPEPTQHVPMSRPLPAPPDPARASNVDELITELNRVPLFMTSLDETNGADGSNAELDALKALQYEGTKAEVADNFRQQGNECARTKKWLDARDFYTQALDVLTGKFTQAAKYDVPADASDGVKQKLDGDVGEREVDWLDKLGDDGGGYDGKIVDLEEEEKRERECEELCCANRALCNLELSKCPVSPMVVSYAYESNGRRFNPSSCKVGAPVGLVSRLRLPLLCPLRKGLGQSFVRLFGLTHVNPIIATSATILSQEP